MISSLKTTANNAKVDNKMFFFMFAFFWSYIYITDERRNLARIGAFL